MERIINAAFLVLFSFEDIHRKSIPFFGALMYLAAGVILSALRIGTDFAGWALEIIPGLTALAVSLVTRGRLGNGDALVILAIGLCLGLRSSAFICVSALALSALASLVIFMVKRDKNYRLAFIPFLLCGAVAEIFIG